MVWGLPTTVKDVVAPLEALPATRATGDPKFDPSTTNWMVPEGAAPAPVTLAVNVTD
jgi:hypothetical protein